MIQTALRRMRSKLLAAFASSLLVLLVAFVASDALSRSELAQAWVDHTERVRAVARELMERLLATEVAQLGWLITGDNALLAPLSKTAPEAHALLDELDRLTLDSPAQHTRMATIRPLVAANLDELTRTIELGTSGHADTAMELVRRNNDRAIFGQLAAELEAVRTFEEARLHERRLATTEQVALTRLVLIVGSVVAFLLSVIVVLLVRRGVADLAHANATIQAQHEELAEKTHALERSLVELDQFAYVASHDLKAPLRGISSLAGWIAEDAGGALSPDSLEHLRLMQGRVARMEALVEGILAYSRAGRKREAVELVDVGHLVRDVVDLIAPPAGATISVGPGLPVLATERVPLQQVLLNLIGNALKHGMHDGKVHVRIGVEPANGPLTGQSAERIYFVADDGPGIDPRFHERVFGLFQTLAPRDRVEGTGIGLAVVKKLVEHHGGRIWLESGPGQGATFRFTWPPDRRASAPRIGAARPP